MTPVAPTTICLDARTVGPHFPGIGRYTINLARALPPLLGEHERLLLLRDPIAESVEDWTAGDPERRSVVDVSVSPFALRQQWVIPQRLRALGAGLYHSPYYLMPARPGVPSVVTIHDLIPLRHPHLFTPLQRGLFTVSVRLAVRAARVVIAVSAATARDLEQRLRVSPQRIAVIAEAADPIFRPQPADAVNALRARLALPERYALYVGSNKPHKNLQRLVEVWARLRSYGVPLVIAGAWDARYPEAKRRAAALGLGDAVRFIGPVDEANLAALYSGAMLFVFPSLDEGFGLPVIEAMACGVPVACSDASSLSELADQAALTFAADDSDAMADALDALLRDPDRRVEMRRRGLARAAQYSWRSTAAATLEVYRRALTGPNASR
ncbi:MAG: glycosyltransferase family 4 protein [Deltaproteobacteria bacterium]|nr:glycosyltransferase family 4 protein [Deltaproteobacteria bacterium]MBI3387978.1 glycosyltransferase family 4 protein [Deltaproteobacteria bacterium]